MNKKNMKAWYANRRQLRRPRRKRRQRRPTLRFSPYAWAKLLFLRDLGPTEVGGFGITEPDDLLFVQDVVLIEQHCTETFVSFDDLAVAEFFEDQVDLGRKPEQFGRIWIHTHPGSSPEPSPTDHDTFQRVFSGCDWAVMAILARGGATYAELHWRQGGPAQLRLDVEVDFTKPFPGSDEAAWEAEYHDAVQEEPWSPPLVKTGSSRMPEAGPLDTEFASFFREPPPF